MNPTPHSFHAWVHLIWTTHGQKPYLQGQARMAVLNQVKSACREADIYLHSINATADHIHVLFKLPPHQPLREVVTLMQTSARQGLRPYLKRESAPCWESGYHAFSVSPRRLPMLRRHILRQHQIHARQTLEQELWEWLPANSQTIQCLLAGTVNSAPTN